MNVISGAKTLKGKSEVKEGVAMKSLKNRVSQLLESYVTKQTQQDYIKEAVKELSKIGWIIIRKKTKYTGISLNPEYKKEIVEFIEKELPHLKGMIQ